MASLTLSIGAMAVAAGAKLPGVHMAMAATISIAIAIISVRENRIAPCREREQDAARRVERVTWAWSGRGALGLPRDLSRRAPLARVVALLLAFAAVAVVCLAVAAMLARDGAAGRQDEAMLKVARTLTMVQLAGMLSRCWGSSSTAR